MNHVIQIKCPSCGVVITPDNIHGTIAHCGSCKSYSVLKNNQKLIKNVFYKLNKFDTDINELKKTLVEEMLEWNEEKLFKRLKLTNDIKRFYLPVREIQQGGQKKLIPLNEEYKSIDTFFLYEDEIQNWMKSSFMEKDFTDLKTFDFKPLYVQKKEDKINFLPIDVSLDRIDALYDQQKSNILIIKYLPLTVIPTNVGEMVALGHKELKIINKPTILNKIKDLKKENEEKKYNVRSIIGGVIFLIILGGIVSAIYKILTMGITTDGFMTFIFNAIGYFLLGIWAALWIGLYAIGAIIIFVPPLLFLLNMISFQRNHSEDNMSEKERAYKNFAVI